MPYKKKSKCSGLPVSDDWKEQVVTFDGRPHVYNTMNLPSWNKHDYPFINKGATLKHCDWVTGSSNTASNHLTMWRMDSHSLSCKWEKPSGSNSNKAIRHKISFKEKMLTGQGSGGLYSPMYYYLYNQASNSTTLKHQRNLLHWDNTSRGATTLMDDGNTDGFVGALFGRLKWPSPLGKYPSDSDNAGRWHDPARWTSQVYGIQFEWDSGIDFTDEEVQTEENSNGFGLQDLFLHFVCIRPSVDGSDEVAETFCMPLFESMRLKDDVCYWYEGYSLWDNIPWRQTGDESPSTGYQPQEIWGYGQPNKNGIWGPGQGVERGNPLRRGKCGFAVDSRSKLWQILHNGTYTVDDYDVEKYGEAGQKNGGIHDYGETYLYSTEIRASGSGKTESGYERKYSNGNLEERSFNEDERVDSPSSGHFILTGITLGLRRWKDGSGGRTMSLRVWNVKPITVPVTYQDPENKYTADKTDYCPYHHGKGTWDSVKQEWSKQDPPGSPVIHDVTHPMGPGHKSGSEQVVNGICDGQNVETSHLRWSDQYVNYKKRGYSHDLPETASMPIAGGYSEITPGNEGGIPT